MQKTLYTMQVRCLKLYLCIYVFNQEQYLKTVSIGNVYKLELRSQFLKYQWGNNSLKRVQLSNKVIYNNKYGLYDISCRIANRCLVILFAYYGIILLHLSSLFGFVKSCVSFQHFSWSVGPKPLSISQCLANFSCKVLLCFCIEGCLKRAH